MELIKHGWFTFFFLNLIYSIFNTFLKKKPFHKKIWTQKSNFLPHFFIFWLLGKRGWSKGRMGNREGYFPINYTKVHKEENVSNKILPLSNSDPNYKLGEHFNDK